MANAKYRAITDAEFKETIDNIYHLQFSYYDFYYTYLLILLFMLFEFEERDILCRNTCEHNSPFWTQFFAIVKQALKEGHDI